MYGMRTIVIHMHIIVLYIVCVHVCVCANTVIALHYIQLYSIVLQVHTLFLNILARQLLHNLLQCTLLLLLQAIN